MINNSVPLILHLKALMLSLSPIVVPLKFDVLKASIFANIYLRASNFCGQLSADRA